MENIATVLRLDGQSCIVHQAGETIRAFIPKRMKYAGEQLKSLAVGDQVRLKTEAGGEVWIFEVMPRTTWLARSSVGKKTKEQVVVANVDQVALVSSIHIPPFRPGLVDRMLIAAHTGKLAPIIVINKCDLQLQVQDWAATVEIIETYRQIGYSVLCVSAVTQEGIAELRDRLSNKSTVFAGHSGVGKSSLVTAIDNTLHLKIQQISAKTKWGQHTTTAVTLLPLSFGGFVVDTPGIREFSLWQLNTQALSSYFPEIHKQAARCKFKSCTHTHEPDCAVKEGVEKGKIAPFRYQSYCRILESGEREIEQSDPGEIW